MSTFIPFEGTDGEDSTALSVGEMITKVQMMRQSMNQERRDTAAKQGTQPDLVPQCEHLWVVSGVSLPVQCKTLADRTGSYAACAREDRRYSRPQAIIRTCRRVPDPSSRLCQCPQRQARYVPCQTQQHQLINSRPSSRCSPGITIVLGIKASSPHSG